MHDVERSAVRAVCAILAMSAATAFLMDSNSRAPQTRGLRTKMLTSSGLELNHFFDGLKQKPAFALDNLRRSNIERRICRPVVAPGWWRGLLSKLDVVTTVKADQYCYATPCTSNYYIANQEPCVGDCSGNYDYPVFDAVLGDPYKGWYTTGTEQCNWVGPGTGHCSCQRLLCDSTPPCTPCDTIHDCPAGKRCENGCCVTYTCPGGYNKCKTSGVPDCLLTDTCENGCCTPEPCDENSDCSSLQFHCYNGNCVPSNCLPNEPYCHVDPDCPTGFLCSTPIGCCYDTGSPIVIDVEGDGYQMTSVGEGVFFDIFADGRPTRVSWTAPASNDAWLALDRNSDGQILDAIELFGDRTPQPETSQANNGFRALAVFDEIVSGGNKDGVISQHDAVYDRLLLWVDRDHNGRSRPAEVSPLRASGITEISLDYKESKWVDAYGNRFKYRAKLTRSKNTGGKGKWAYDVFLVVGRPGHS